MQRKFFSSGAGPQACLVMYRMGGLRHVLLYLYDLLKADLSLVRINAVYVNKDATSIINMADTSTVSVSNKSVVSGTIRPLIMSEQIMEPLILNDLSPYQRDPLILGNPLWADMPYLQHKRLLRLPLFANDENVFLMNFWSDDRMFSEEDFADLEPLLAPLAEELDINLSGTKIHGAKPSAPFFANAMHKLSLCPGLMDVRETIKSLGPTEMTVLLLGETGVGKEVIADAIQAESRRKDAPFIKVNCGAIPENLVDSELFGHEKGSFTGALATKRGFFEMADGGTLFLDEIGEMTLASQVRLLRVLETGMIRRVGGSREFPVNVRIIAATHDDLLRKVVEGTFRRDLWYRLSVLPIHIPPLRRRMDDIPVLVRYFVEKKAESFGIPSFPLISEEEMHSLLMYPWPGNVRELEHAVDRALVNKRMHPDKKGLHFELIPLPEEQSAHAEKKEAGASMALLRKEGEWPSLREMEDRYIREVLEHCGGKLTGADSATSLLDIHYTTLRTRMRRMGLMPDDE